jgi:glycosyltransferase involved in cell wall biosynthesis
MNKIAFVGNELWSMYNFRGGVIKALKEKGYDITIITPKDNRIDITKELNVKFIEIPLERKGTNPLNDLKYLLNLYKIYKKNKFDLIFHYTIKPNIYGSIAAGLLKIPSIAVTTGLGYVFLVNNFTSKVAKFLYKISLRFAKKVWFLNLDDKNEFLKNKIIRENIADILPGEGVNTEKFKPRSSNELKKDKIIFLMIARVLWDKGFKEYVEAAEKILKKYNNVEFQLLGPIDNGNPSGVKKEIIEDYVQKEVINYLGVTSDVTKYIVKCDCIVLPSFREGIPRVLLEAASMEKALITTNNVGCKEVVEDGYNGFLCKVKDSNDLANKMEKFINLPEEEKIKLGKNGREKVIKEFDEKIVIEKYIQEINKILN